jgi:hypothetical protein
MSELLEHYMPLIIAEYERLGIADEMDRSLLKCLRSTMPQR